MGVELQVYVKLFFLVVNITQHSSCHMTPFGHSHLAVVQQHAVHLLNGTVGSVLSFKMHEGIALRPVLIAHHLFIRNGVS